MTPFPKSLLVLPRVFLININIVISVLVFPTFTYAQNTLSAELLKNANHFFVTGQYDSAVFFYKKFVSLSGVELSGKKPGNGNRKENIRVAKACLQIANICTLQREYHDAESWFHKALDLAENGSSLKAEVYQNLGSLFFLRENYGNAILNYRKSYILYTKEPGRNSPGIVDLLSSLGTSYSGNGEYRKSLTCFRKADSLLKISGIHDPMRLAGLNINTGEIMLKLDAPAKALKHYRMARNLGSDNGISSPDILIPAEEGMAECYSRLGRTDSAMACLENCLILVKNYGTNRGNETSRICFFMGKIQAREKVWERSIKYYDQSMAALFPDSLNFSFKEANNRYDPDLLDLYKILEYRGRSRLQFSFQSGSDIAALTGAYRDFLTALKICDHISKDFGHGSSRMAFQESTKSILDGAVESGFILNSKTGRPCMDELFSLADGSKNRLLLGDMEENRILELSGVPDSIRSEIRELKDEIVFYTRKYVREESSHAANLVSGLHELQNKLIDLQLGLDSLRKKIDLYYPAFPAQTQNKKKGDPSAIMKILKNDEAILEYLSADSVIYLFLVRTDGLLMKRVTLPPSFKGCLLDCLHQLKGAETRNFTSLSISLYNYLIAPVSSQLKGIRRLVIIPDEELSLFPFETLIRNDQNGFPIAETSGQKTSSIHYLLRDFDISYHFSAESWYRDTAREGRLMSSNRFAGFAPVFRNGSTNPLSMNPLPFSLKEVTGIARLFGKNESEPILFSDTSSTEKTFRQVAPSCSHIHIATHSRVNEIDPMNSALVFSGNHHSPGHQDKDDGLLHLDEIGNLKLDASLVVLSACATGEGKITKTEGVMALTRGFYLAGASNVVYSLWSIPDHLTCDFMLNFYRNYFSGKSYSTALREVKLNMISRPETSLPFMWAGIVLLGR